MKPTKTDVAMTEVLDQISLLRPQAKAMIELLLSDRATLPDLHAAKQLDKDYAEATARLKTLGAKLAARNARWLRMRLSRRSRQRAQQWARYFDLKP
jgi:hypothetical protein